MSEIEAVIKVKELTRRGKIDRDDFGFEQRHEDGTDHYHTVLFVGQNRLGFVSIEMQAKTPRKTTLGYFTLSPADAKALANALNRFADAAQEDRNNPEFARSIEELPDSLLS
jgi:hypothetical protein